MNNREIRVLYDLGQFPCAGVYAVVAAPGTVRIGDRGGWEALAQLPMPAAVRLAAAQAKLYEDAMREYPGFMVSRRNYDVAQGLDGKGEAFGCVSLA